MEGENKHMECNCGMCQGWKMHGMGGMGMGMHHWRGHGHFLIRLAIGLVILLMVFCLGVIVGEFKGELRSGGYGYTSYKQHNMMPVMDGYDDPRQVIQYDSQIPLR